jgi:hypothetical protein
MKKVLAVFLLVGLAACADDTTAPIGPELDLGVAALSSTPKAPLLYHLNIIGAKFAKNDNTLDEDWGGNGHRIFVALGTKDDGVKTKIMLTAGDDFAVLDANGTDGVAEFQMPPPGLDPYIIGDPNGADTESSYSVFIRPLGKPGGWATITTCADVLDSSFGGLLTGQQINIMNDAGELGGMCSLEQVGQELTMRKVGKNGKSTWSNVTAELTTIVFEVEVTDDLGVVQTFLVRVPIFDPALENEYWEYDNHGLKLLQVRFYECSTDVEAGTDACY